MNAVKIPMGRDKKIALVAHDNMKRDCLSGPLSTATCWPITWCTPPVPRAAFLNEFRGERRLDLVIECVVREAAS